MENETDLPSRVGDLESVRTAFEEMPVMLAAVQGPNHRFVAANRA